MRCGSTTPATSSCSVPRLRAIKTTSPDCQITLLASPAGAKAAPLLPWVDSVLVWRSIWQDLGQLPFDPARENELIQLIAERSFDAAVIFTSFSQTPHVAAYVCYLAGIPLRAGESKEFGGGTLSTELRGTPDATHQVDRNLHLVQALGFTEVDPALEIAIPDASREVGRAAPLERRNHSRPAVRHSFILVRAPRPVAIRRRGSGRWPTSC